MSENRKCVNCRHRIIGENCSSKCEIDGHRIDYAECFEGWCRHWAKQKALTDKELAKKMIVVDEIHTNQGGFYKLPNGLYAHYSCGKADQPEEIEEKATDLENTEIAKSFEQELREHNEHSYKVWWERIKEQIYD